MGDALWLDLDSRGNIDDGFACDAATLARRSGLNLGNLVFRRALRNIVDMDDARAVDYTGALRACDAARPSRLIVSAANWLGSGPDAERDNEFRRRLFEAADCPIAVFGIGVQAKGSAVPELGPRTQDFVRLLSERSPLIGARDEMTRETLGRLGVDNVTVAGCPSNFLNLSHGLGQRLRERATRVAQTPYARLRLHITEASGGHSASSAVRARGLEMLRDTASVMVVQSPALLPFLLGETTKLPDEYLAHAVGLGMTIDALTACVRERTLHFSSVDAWMDLARTCDLSVGMRIHGAMVAIQSGVPALLIAHDSRTSGLGQTMGLPVISPESYLDLSARRLESVATLLQQSYRHFDAVRAVLAKRTMDVVERNGLTPTRAFARFCNTAHAEARTERPGWGTAPSPGFA